MTEIEALELSLPRAVIRSWQPQDTPSLVRHANNHSVWRNLRDRFPHPYTAADAERWIRTATEAVPQTRFAIAIGNEAIGGIGLDLNTQCTRRYSSGIRPRSGCSRGPATPSKDACGRA